MRRAMNYFIAWIMAGLAVMPVLGQSFDYRREESPAGSWNGIPLYDARSLGSGGISLFGSRALAVLANPALVPGAGKPGAALTLSSFSFQAFQYWGINEGVVREFSPLEDRKSGLSGFSFFVPGKKIRLAAGFYAVAALDLPDFLYQERYWYYDGRFWGREEAVFLALALAVNRKLDIGLRLDYRYGRRNVAITEHDYFAVDDQGSIDYVIYRRRENHRLTYIEPCLGAAMRLSPAITLDASFSLPLAGKVREQASLEFDNRREAPIVFSDETEDKLYRPARCSLGVMYKNPAAQKHKGAWGYALGAEITGLFWSTYRYIYLGQEIPRHMRNTVVLALGGEYGFYGPGEFVFRFGYRYDPQPVREPAVTLHVMNAGFGFRTGVITTHLGFAYCLDAGTDVRQNHSILNGTLSIDL